MLIVLHFDDSSIESLSGIRRLTVVKLLKYSKGCYPTCPFEEHLKAQCSKTLTIFVSFSSFCSEHGELEKDSWAVVVHAFNTITQEAEANAFLSFWTAWSTERVLEEVVALWSRPPSLA